MSAVHPSLLHNPAWRELGLADLDAIEALHRSSIGAAGPDVVKPENRDFFAGLLKGRGRLVGLFEQELVAYGVLQHDILANDDPREQLGYGASTSIAKLAGAAVASTHRGQGLQRALIRQRITMASEHDVLFSTAAPANVVSWTNLLAEGFETRAIIHRYGGLQRYLMLRERVPATLDDMRITVPAANLERQADLLTAGWRGVATVEPLTPLCGIVFARPTGVVA